MDDDFDLGTNIVECLINAFNKAGDGKVDSLKPDASAVERSIVDTLNRNAGSLNGRELFDILKKNSGMIAKTAIKAAGVENVIIYLLCIRSLNMEFEDLKKKLKSFKNNPSYTEAIGLDDKKEAVNKLLELKDINNFSRPDTEWIEGEIKKGDNYFEDNYPSIRSFVDLPLVENYEPNNVILNDKVYKCFNKFLIDKGLLTLPNDDEDESPDKDVESELKLESASSMGAESAGPDGSVERAHIDVKSEIELESAASMGPKSVKTRKGRTRHWSRHRGAENRTGSRYKDDLETKKKY